MYYNFILQNKTFNLTMTTSEKQHNPSMRGRVNVEEKLLKASCKLLAQKGPKGVSNRDIAKQAGVNHGQIHHYFGSKRGLLKAAISKLAHEHWDHTQRDGMSPLALGKDQTYILAVIRCAIDGDLELATLELRENISVPRQALQKYCDNRSPSQTEADVKGQLAAAMGIEMAWAVMAPYIIATLNIEPDEVDIVKQKIADILVSIAEY
jgi:AcrR family transcriptional regulator